jgi:hypothetical protein
MQFVTPLFQQEHLVYDYGGLDFEGANQGDAQHCFSGAAEQAQYTSSDGMKLLKERFVCVFLRAFRCVVKIASEQESI